MDLTKSRIALVSLAKKRGRRASESANRHIVMELYTEIRECRLKGHGWKAIRNAICDGTGVTPFCPEILSRWFRIIDAEYEEETGVPALKTGRKQAAQKKQIAPKARPNQPRKVWE